MSWLSGLLFIASCGVVVYIWWRHRSKIEPDQPQLDDEKHRELWAVLEEAIASYKKKRLAYAIRQEALLGNYPESTLKSLEDLYGKAEGCPYLSLPQEWQSKSARGIRAWMLNNNLPYSAELPALHQLEKLLEDRLQQEAKAILDKAVNRD